MSVERDSFRFIDHWRTAASWAFAMALAAPVMAARPQLGIVQLTVTTGCDGNFYPALDATGQKIAFTSFCDLVPGGNADGNSELFFMNADGTGLRQLTASIGGVGSFNTSLDAGGHRIVFTSDRDLLPGENADGNLELFGINVDGTGLRQLTHTTGGNQPCGFPGNSHPRFDFSGQKITFDSDRDLVPGQNADGNGELFVMNADGTGVVQLTSTTGNCGSGEGSLDGTGTQVVFDSDHDLVPGGNADGNSEIFKMNVDGSGLVQLTNTVNPNGVGSFQPWWTADTKTIVFVGDGSDGVTLQLFRMNGDGTRIVQVTYAPSVLTSPWGITPDGKTISIESPSDLVPGSNSDLNFELYLMRLRP